MEPVERGGKPEVGKPGRSSLRREKERAAGLRANLQRRKAQARGRADPAPPQAGTARDRDQGSD